MVYIKKSDFCLSIQETKLYITHWIMVTKVTSIRTCKLAEKCYTLQNIKDQNWKNIKSHAQTDQSNNHSPKEKSKSHLIQLQPVMRPIPSYQQLPQSSPKWHNISNLMNIPKFDQFSIIAAIRYLHPRTVFPYCLSIKVAGSMHLINTAMHHQTCLLVKRHAVL
jgi:hypothetical protein